LLHEPTGFGDSVRQNFLLNLLWLLFVILAGQECGRQIRAEKPAVGRFVRKAVHRTEAQVDRTWCEFGEIPGAFDTGPAQSC
jgi:hypothetical protein